MRKFFVVLVWVMGLGLAALFAKDIVRGVKNVIAINHFTPVEVNNAPTGWHQDLCCYLNLKSASNLNGNLNCSKELEHYAS